MADFIYSGGVRFEDDKVIDVKADKDGNPIEACNPITGVCLEGGGGDSDFSICTVEFNTTSGAVSDSTTILSAIAISQVDTIVADGDVDVNDMSLNVVLYKNSQVIDLASTQEITASGDIELTLDYFDDEEGIYYYYANIMGDCVINCVAGGTQ